MKRRPTKQGVVSDTTGAVKNYLDAIDRLAQLAGKLTEAESRLVEARAAKDEKLLTAVTRWTELSKEEQPKLSQLVFLFGPGIAKTLLESVSNGSAQMSKSPVTSPQAKAADETGK